MAFAQAEAGDRRPGVRRRAAAECGGAGGLDGGQAGRRPGDDQGLAHRIEAGADMLLKPADVDASFRGVLNAVKSGRITEQRVEESARKILAAKYDLGLVDQRITPLDTIDRVVGSPDVIKLATEIAEHAVTLYRDTDEGLEFFTASLSNVHGGVERVEAHGRGTWPWKGRWFEPRPRAEAEALFEARVAARRAEELRQDLATIVDGSKGSVTWLDTSGRSAQLSSSPVDLSTLLRTRLFESVPSVVLTSATLSNGASKDAGPGAFDFVRSRLGIDGDAIAVSEVVVPSPFDYAPTAGP